jgi:hypothetical protein
MPAELGFMAVLSIEPIYECLASSRLLPQCQKEGWDDFWNTENWDFLVTEPGAGYSELKASVSRCNDGHQVYVGLYCRDASTMEQGLAAAVNVAPADRIRVTRSDEMHACVLFLSYDEDALTLADRSVRAAREAMTQFGYEEQYRGSPGAPA